MDVSGRETGERGGLVDPLMRGMKRERDGDGGARDWKRERV